MATQAWLDALGERERQELLAIGVPRRYGDGEVIFHAGDAGDSLHLVRRGRVGIRVTSRRGDTDLLTVLRAGELFGELGLLEPGARRSASAVALGAVETTVFVAAAYEELRSRYPQIERVLTLAMAQQVRRLTERLQEALHVPADRRVVRRLIDLADAEATGGDDEVAIDMRQEELASLAGTTRATANRALRELERGDVIALTRGRILVRDRAALARWPR